MLFAFVSCAFEFVGANSVAKVLPPETRTPRSSSGRTGSWYHLLVRHRPYRGHPALSVLPAPSLRAIGRSRRGSRVTFTLPARSGSQPVAGISARAEER